MVKIAFNSALAQKALGKEVPASDTVNDCFVWCVCLSVCLSVSVCRRARVMPLYSRHHVTINMAFMIVAVIIYNNAHITCATLRVNINVLYASV